MKISKDILQQALKKTLPGENAHSKVMSYSRASVNEARQMSPPPRESAVMMIVFPFENQLSTAFTLRHEYNGVHSGQISFPGGKKEESDSEMIDTAIRETEEEVGVVIQKKDIIGELSEVYIPPSHFVVRPFVAWLDYTPQFSIQEAEVNKLLIEPITHFFAPDALKKKEIFIPTLQRSIEAPSFDVQGRTLWGATAMMITEFKMMLEEFS